CDDISFDAGQVRIRRRGSHGGHNGLRNIAAMIGSEDYPRIKLGVGKKPRPDYDLVDWVLGKMPPADREALENRAADVENALALILQGKIDEAMNKYSK
ncbi:MAG: aminoacyl-tRNA hydrolase, partial [Clostridia bacterium]|nr:aminoacyl-tRNA hydrolase [Clostridia bacterium]